MPTSPTTPVPSTTAPPGPPRARLVSLDVLRGLALCGITLANVVPIASTALAGGPPARAEPGVDVAHLFVDGRFFPVFSLLFGIGFSLVLESAAARAVHPRLVLARRLAVLLVIGLAHHLLLWPGDILVVYAAVGLTVLLPSTWLPRWAALALSCVLLVAATALGAGTFALVPGLFLLGSALVRCGVVRRFEGSTRVPAWLGLALAACAVPATTVQARLEATGDIATPAYQAVFSLAGLLVAGVYVCLVLVLLRTPLRPVLHAVFAPLGRMALTLYLATSALVLGLAHVTGITEDWSSGEVLVIAGSLLAGLWLFATLWFRRFRYGPAEWLWRWATWLARPPLRRPADPAQPSYAGLS